MKWYELRSNGIMATDDLRFSMWILRAWIMVFWVVTLKVVFKEKARTCSLLDHILHSPWKCSPVLEGILLAVPVPSCSWPVFLLSSVWSVHHLYITVPLPSPADFYTEDGGSMCLWNIVTTYSTSHCHRISHLGGWHCCLVFRRSQVQISMQRPAILTKVFHSFLQCFHANARIVV